jgi:glutaredoxin 3
MSENIVWTTKYCPFCDKAKELLTNAGFIYETRLVDENRWTLHDLLVYAPEARTYPQIFLGNKHIGGCDDLEYYLSVQDMAINGL